MRQTVTMTMPGGNTTAIRTVLSQSGIASTSSFSASSQVHPSLNAMIAITAYTTKKMIHMAMRGCARHASSLLMVCSSLVPSKRLRIPYYTTVI